MRVSLSHLLLTVLLLAILTGCAHHQSMEYAETTTQKFNCEATDSDVYDKSHCHEHNYYNGGAGVIGYIVVRVVVESIVHALIYR